MTTAIQFKESAPSLAVVADATEEKTLKIVDGKVNITNHPEKRAQVARFKELKAQKAAIEKELGDKDHPALEAEIAGWMTGANEAIVNGVTALKRSSQRHTDYYDAKTLKNAFPEAAAAAFRTTLYTFFTAS